jgi:hypothetical protein
LVAPWNSGLKNSLAIDSVSSAYLPNEKQSTAKLNAGDSGGAPLAMEKTHTPETG